MSEDRVGDTIRRARIALTTFSLVAAPMLGAMGTTALLAIYLVASSSTEHVGAVPQVIAAGGLFGEYNGALPSLLLGWPIHLAMQRYKLTRASFYVIGGSLIAAINMMIIWTLSGAYGG